MKFGLSLNWWLGKKKEGERSTTIVIVVFIPNFNTIIPRRNSISGDNATEHKLSSPLSIKVPLSTAPAGSTHICYFMSFAQAPSVIKL